jgi:transcriptional regulator with XRE-family HTH domain
MNGGALKLDRDKMIRARVMLGYGVEKTAEEAGVSKNSVLRAEHGEDIRPVTARKIAAALGVRVADLLGESETLKVQPPLPDFNGQWRLDASFWIECLIAQAELGEHIIGRGDYDLETVWKLEGAVVEFLGTYSRTVKRLVHEWCSPEQMKLLERAEERMKEVRRAARRAYQDRREAEQDRRKVVELDAQRQKREERYAGEGYANTGA